MSEILNYAKSVVGKLVDFDGVYGGQCADLSTAAVWDVLGVRLYGNAIDAGSTENMTNMKANTRGHKVERLNNSATFVPKAGDILVESSDDNPFGHISIVVSATSTTMDVIEQNYTGSGYVPSPNGVERRTRSYLQYVNYAIRITKENEQKNKGEIEMYLIYTIDTKNWYVSNGVQCKWVKTERMLKNYQDEFGKLNLRVDKMYSSELYAEFPKNKIIK